MANIISDINKKIITHMLNDRVNLLLVEMKNNLSRVMRI